MRADCDTTGDDMVYEDFTTTDSACYVSEFEPFCGSGRLLSDWFGQSLAVLAADGTNLACGTIVEVDLDDYQDVRMEINDLDDNCPVPDPITPPDDDDTVIPPDDDDTVTPPDDDDSFQFDWKLVASLSPADAYDPLSTVAGSLSTVSVDSADSVPSSALPRINQVVAYTRTGTSFCAGIKLTYKDGTEVELILPGTSTNASAPLNIGDNDYIQGVTATPDDLRGSSNAIALQIDTFSGSLTCGNVATGTGVDLVLEDPPEAALSFDLGFEDSTGNLTTVQLRKIDLTSIT
jgi:hypothetical protein